MGEVAAVAGSQGRGVDEESIAVAMTAPGDTPLRLCIDRLADVSRSSDPILLGPKMFRLLFPLGPPVVADGA